MPRQQDGRLRFLSSPSGLKGKYQFKEEAVPGFHCCECRAYENQAYLGCAKLFIDTQSRPFEFGNSGSGRMNNSAMN